MEFDGLYCSGLIIEVEVYWVLDDKVCYVYNNWCIKWIEIMFWFGGVVYVYFCYGIYYLFNVVIGDVEMVYVVLIRVV